MHPGLLSSEKPAAVPKRLLIPWRAALTWGNYHTPDDVVDVSTSDEYDVKGTFCKVRHDVNSIPTDLLYVCRDKCNTFLSYPNISDFMLLLILSKKGWYS